MLEDLGNIGDFLGGIAVIATLIYLALQVRHNTVSVEAATVQSGSQAFAEILDSFMKDPELMRLYLAGCQDFNGLAFEEKQRYAAIMGSVLHRFEGLIELSDRGLLPEQSWDGAVNRVRGAFQLPGTQDWWQKGQHVFNPRLRSWIESSVMENDGATTE